MELAGRGDTGSRHRRPHAAALAVFCDYGHADPCLRHRHQHYIAADDAGWTAAASGDQERRLVGPISSCGPGEHDDQRAVSARRVRKRPQQRTGRGDRRIQRERRVGARRRRSDRGVVRVGQLVQRAWLRCADVRRPDVQRFTRRHNRRARSRARLHLLAQPPCRRVESRGEHCVPRSQTGADCRHRAGRDSRSRAGRARRLHSDPSARIFLSGERIPSGLDSRRRRDVRQVARWRVG